MRLSIWTKDLNSAQTDPRFEPPSALSLKDCLVHVFLIPCLTFQPLFPSQLNQHSHFSSSVGQLYPSHVPALSLLYLQFQYTGRCLSFTRLSGSWSQTSFPLAHQLLLSAGFSPGLKPIETSNLTSSIVSLAHSRLGRPCAL